MEIFIKLCTGKMLTIEVEGDDTIEAVKQKICEHRGGQPSQIRLIWVGKQLDERRTIANYGITKESTLHDVLRERGGMYDPSSGGRFNLDKIMTPEKLEKFLAENGKDKGYWNQKFAEYFPPP